MTNLSDADLKTIRDKLESERNRLTAVERRLEKEALEGLKADTVGEVSHIPQHTADVGDLAAMQNIDFTLAGSELREIAGIERAVAKLNSTGYGVCERCGNPIARERLLALPAAPFCLACERQFESRQNARKKPGDTSPYIQPLEDEKEIPY